MDNHIRIQGICDAEPSVKISLILDGDRVLQESPNGPTIKERLLLPQQRAIKGALNLLQDGKVQEALELIQSFASNATIEELEYIRGPKGNQIKNPTWGGKRPGAGRPPKKRDAEHLLWEPEAQGAINQAAILYAVKAAGFDTIEALLATDIWPFQWLSVPPNGVYETGNATVYTQVEYKRSPTANNAEGYQPICLAIEVHPNFSCEVQEIGYEKYRDAYNFYKTRLAQRMKEEHGIDQAPRLLS